MLLNKVNNYFEEIKFFLDSNSGHSDFFIQYLKSINNRDVYSDSQSVYLRSTVVKILILYRILGIKSIYEGVSSQMKQFLPVGKNVFFKVMNSPKINWRSILYKSVKKSMEGVSASDDTCFILDDTDIAKTGRKIELVGKIFSHKDFKFHLGFKCLNLAFWSGKHLLHLDFSKHIEAGKNGTQGMRKKDLERRYSKESPQGTFGAERKAEAHSNKIDQSIKMIRSALKRGIRAKYVLADSWFFCFDLVSCALKNNLHLLSRPKLNKWKYSHRGKERTLEQIIKSTCRLNKPVRMRAFKYKYCKTEICFQGVTLQLFLYKENKRLSKWHCLVTTDLTISAAKAFRLYRNRWAIEVSYKELKETIGLGKSQSNDFLGQIAHTTMSLMTYNYLSHLKCVQDYESIGGIFNEISKQWIKPHIIERIWQLIQGILNEIAEFFEVETEDLVRKAITEFDSFKKLFSFNLSLGRET